MTDEEQIVYYLSQAFDVYRLRTGYHFPPRTLVIEFNTEAELVDAQQALLELMDLPRGMKVIVPDPHRGGRFVHASRSGGRIARCNLTFSSGVVRLGTVEEVTCPRCLNKIREGK